MENEPSLSDPDDALLAVAFTRFPDAIGAEVTRFVLRYPGSEPSFGYSAKVTLPRRDKRGRKLPGHEDFSGGYAETKAEAMEKAIKFAEWSLNEKGVK